MLRSLRTAQSTSVTGMIPEWVVIRWLTASEVESIAWHRSDTDLKFLSWTWIHLQVFQRLWPHQLSQCATWPIRDSSYKAQPPSQLSNRCFSRTTLYSELGPSGYLAASKGKVNGR